MKGKDDPTNNSKKPADWRIVIDKSPNKSKKVVNHGDRTIESVPPTVVSKTIEEDDNVHQSNDLNGSKVSKPLDFIETSDPKVAKAGDVVRFMHDAKEDEGLFYWLSGRILQRVTNASRAKHLKYAENYFNIGELRVISV